MGKYSDNKANMRPMKMKKENALSAGCGVSVELVVCEMGDASNPLHRKIYTLSQLNS